MDKLLSRAAILIMLAVALLADGLPWWGLWGGVLLAAGLIYLQGEDVDMGCLKKHGMVMLGDTPPGTCPMCAVSHDPAQPHDQQSLTYQYKFYDQHGHWPTWADAMAHCSQEVKHYWCTALAERNIAIDVAPETEGGL